jgi:hypothetical protein
MIMFPGLYDAAIEQKPDSLKGICGDGSGVVEDGKDRIQKSHYTTDNGHDICELRIFIANLVSPSPTAVQAMKFLDVGITPAPSGFLHYIVQIKTSYGQKLTDDQETALIGHYFTANVRSSKIISSNGGSISDDNTVATAKIPLANVLSSAENKYSDVVEVQNTPGWLNPFVK